MTINYRRCTILGVVVVALSLHGSIRVGAFLLEWPANSQRSRHIIFNEVPLPSSPGGKDSNNPSNDLLERAAQLRKEIKELESQVTSKRPTPQSSGTVEKAIEYTDIADSVWSLAYRFSDEPEPADDTSSNKTEETRRRRQFYSGKVVLKFRSDGYTEILDQEQLLSSAESPSAKAEIVKVWGWDIEESNNNDDGEVKYLLFSMDVKLPLLNGGTTQQRFYYQARQIQDPRSQTISLSEGTVTIKSDVVQKSARWGFFSPAGILAQFRYVGDFIAKPTTESKTL